MPKAPSQPKWLKHRKGITFGQHLLNYKLRQCQLANPLRRMPSLDEHFYTHKPPPTSCLFTAGILDSLHGSTKSGLYLTRSLLQDRSTSTLSNRPPPPLETWNAVSLGMPLLITSKKGSRKSHLSDLMKMRTSVNQLQTDLRRLLEAPSLHL